MLRSKDRKRSPVAVSIVLQCKVDADLKFYGMVYWCRKSFNNFTHHESSLTGWFMLIKFTKVWICKSRCKLINILLPSGWHTSVYLRTFGMFKKGCMILICEVSPTILKESWTSQEGFTRVIEKSTNHLFASFLHCLRPLRQGPWLGLHCVYYVR